jgi:hypothetical protein
MSQAKRASKGKRPSKAVSVLGIAGASLAASASGSVADIPVGDTPPSQNPVPFQIFLGEEEISDVSLATFHLFDKEDLGLPRIQLARGGCGCGGCGHGGGCGRGGFGGCGHGGFGGCGRGCGFGRGCGGRGCGYGGCGWGWWGGCGGCYWGWGWGGCCLSWGGCAWC